MSTICRVALPPPRISKPQSCGRDHAGLEPRRLPAGRRRAAVRQLGRLIGLDAKGGAGGQIDGVGITGEDAGARAQRLRRGRRRITRQCPASSTRQHSDRAGPARPRLRRRRSGAPRNARIASPRARESLRSRCPYDSARSTTTWYNTRAANRRDTITADDSRCQCAVFLGHPRVRQRRAARRLRHRARRDPRHRIRGHRAGRLGLHADRARGTQATSSRPAG